MAVYAVRRSILNKVPVDQVIRMSTNYINIGNVGAVEKWARVRRMWGGLVHGKVTREECEKELAWAMGYNTIIEDVK